MAKKKKIPTASKHRLIIFGTLSILLMGYFFVTLFNYMVSINNLKNQQQDLKKELTSLQADADDLSTTIQRLKDPDYLARYARENYLYSKDGEYIIKIEEKEKPKKETKVSNSYYYYISGVAGVCIILFIMIVKKK